MMDYFRKLPGFKRSPSGIEWTILRILPRVVLLGTIAPAVLVSALYLGDFLDPVLLDRIRIFAIASVILFWTLVAIVGFGAFIVMVMKGPAYVADPYYPPDFKDKDDEDDSIL